ncbi:MAG: class C sortase [Ruminococcus sp.]|nr:class C sortase [Ruminococcus sp.]
MKKKRETLITVILIFIFLAGLSVMLYPTVSNWWNQRMQMKAIVEYKETVAQLDEKEIDARIAEAREYNRKLAMLSAPFRNYDQIEGYDDILDISGTGIMGYITIPCIRVELPIYHGTDEGVLQIAAGHIKGSSFPVGGASTHSVISGHRGLPSAKLFSDLDDMVEGDIFTVNVLNEVLTYEVEKIIKILPDQTEELAIIPQEDYMTLMTCTPYGVNTHRLLIRAHRIDNFNQGRRVKVPADALQVDRMTIMPLILVPLIAVLVIYWIITGKRKKDMYIDKYIIEKIKLPKDGE